MADNTNSAGIPVIEIKETGEQGLYDLFFDVEKGLGKGILDVVNAIAPKLLERVKLNFTTSGQRGGQPPWVVKKNPTPLIDTGALMRSMESFVIEQNDKYVIVIGTDKDYAKLHNEGGKTNTDVFFSKKHKRETGSYWLHTGVFGDLKIPKREFMFITEEDTDDVDEMVDHGMKVAFAGFEE